MDSSVRLANRLKHAATLWSRYVDAPAARQLDKWLADSLRADKRFGSQDRRFYSDVLFASARMVTFALFRQQVSGGITAYVRASAAEREAMTRAYYLSVSAEKSLWENIRKVAPEHLVEMAHDSLNTDSSVRVERDTLVSHLLLQPNWSEEDLRILLTVHGIPAAWAPRFLKRVQKSHWGKDQILDFLRMQNERPPLWIRLNRASAKAEVDEDLKSHELQVTWLDDGECARVTGAFGVYQANSFKAGLFEVQDWASQQIARTVNAQPGHKIWDACAGGGGKSVAIAASLKGKGALYASDIREHKLLEAKRRCQRAGFHNIRTLAWNGEVMPSFGREVFIQAGFDAVLVDAPCTSSGTWRRNPDARLRVGEPAGRETLYQLQKALLQRAATQIRPGGRLVYGTCSWCVEENEDVFSAVSEVLPPGIATQLSMELFGAPGFDSDTMFAASFVRGVAES